jgi:hypothetical protein
MQANSRTAATSIPGSTGRGPVVVCGAGAAGIAAALAAARRGAEVCLIEARERIGGTVTHALIHTLAGFFDVAGEMINPGLSQELVERLERARGSASRRRMGRTRVLAVAPEVYLDVVERMIAEESRIRVLVGSSLTRVECKECRVIYVEGLSGQEHFCAAPRAVIDTSGTGEVVRLIDPALIENDPERAAGGLVFRLRGIAPGAIDFPNGLAVIRALRDAAVQGELSADCRHAWIDRGLASDEVYVKLFVPMGAINGHDFTNGFLQHLHQSQKTVVDFLRRLDGFQAARVEHTGQIGIRDGGRVRGEYQLTGMDVRQGRRFEDAACRGGWPIEYWHPESGLSLEYLPADCTYDIPLRALKVRGVNNAWAAGKCLSADREAQASARVVGCCWAMGEAAGCAAAAQ